MDKKNFKNKLTNYAMFMVFIICSIRQAINLLKFDTVFFGIWSYIELLYVLISVIPIYLLILGLFYLPIILIIELTIILDLSTFEVKFRYTEYSFKKKEYKVNMSEVYQRFNVIRC